MSCVRACESRVHPALFALHLQHMRMAAHFPALEFFSATKKNNNAAKFFVS